MKRVKNFFFFEDSIDRVFGYLKDFKKTDSLFEDIRSATEITKGINTFEPGNLFHYSVNNVKINFEVLEFNEQENIKSIKWHVSVEGTDIDYDYEYILHKCTIGGDLILEWNLIFKETTKIESDMVLKDLNECMLRIKKKLKTDLTDYYVCDAQVLKSDRTFIKNLILSLNTLKNHQCFFGKLKFYGDPKEVGCKMVAELPLLGIEVKYNVEVADFDENHFQWTYSLKSKSSSNPNTPSNTYIKEIIFTIIKISKDKTFVEVKHTFNQLVSKEKLILIKEEEGNFLKELKQIIHDNKKKNNQEEKSKKGNKEKKEKGKENEEKEKEEKEESASDHEENDH